MDVREMKPDAESRVQIDTGDVRVVEWHLRPGASTGPRRHTCDFVVVPLTTGQLHVVSAIGESSMQIARGTSLLRAAPFEHDISNRGDASLVFIEVELKQTGRRLISA